MITFNTGEVVNIPNAVVMVGGEFEDSDLVSVCKWDSQDVEYCKVPAYYLRYGAWW